MLKDVQNLQGTITYFRQFNRGRRRLRLFVAKLQRDVSGKFAGEKDRKEASERRRNSGQSQPLVVRISMRTGLSACAGAERCGCMRRKRDVRRLFRLKQN